MSLRVFYLYVICRVDSKCVRAKDPILADLVSREDSFPIFEESSVLELLNS